MPKVDRHRFLYVLLHRTLFFVTSVRAVSRLWPALISRSQVLAGQRPFPATRYPPDFPIMPPASLRNISDDSAPRDFGRDQAGQAR